MSISNRILNLRKQKGISQEELANIIGVSRQSVSKWESEQSTPDIEKIILMSEFFGVTTDYILKGTEPPAEGSGAKPNLKIFALAATALNFIGLVCAVTIWTEKYTTAATAAGIIIMAIGCMIFGIGKNVAPRDKKTSCAFAAVNIWILSLIPISCVFNAVQGILGMFWWTFSPIPQLENSVGAYILCWAFYIAVCIGFDAVLLKQIKNPTAN